MYTSSMSKISFCYFDIGGVLIKDFSGTNKWQELKTALGVTKQTEPQFDAIWQQHRNRICIDCDVDTLLSQFQTIPEIKISENYSMLADFVDRFEQNPSIWPLAEHIKQQMPVGLLTNQYPRMLAGILQRGLLPAIDWNVVIDSSVVGYQKPQPELFQLAEELAGVEPAEIFFVDNKADFITAAAERGWQTVLYNPQDTEKSNQTIRDVLALT